ncbi:hypothetical protein IU448_23240 [Nocardia flavorosea]|uniref:hypothetical protein n=2 Tax=Nocardia TaxID=1817 RepID=UPI0018958607|nr:hypothetical protein [Nocardia flavorosea]MBF6351907.1 hypothetical protein [Nocardia flavorosea]
MSDAVAALRGVPGGARHVTIHATNFIGGDATIGTQVGRDNIGNATGRRPVARGEVATERIALIERVFVEPTRFANIRRILTTQSLLLLRAPRGWGRTTAALRALDECCSARIYTLEPDVELRSPNIDFSPDTGYLMEWFGPDQAGRLHRFHLDQLSAALRDQGCRMVVLLDAATELAPDLGEFLVDGDAPADVTEVVRSHVRYHLNRDPTDILDHPELRRLIDRYTKEWPAARTLAQLGKELADTSAEGGDISEVIRRHHAAIKTELRRWFDEQLSSEARAFTIALAVFNGMPVYMVSDAARMLARVIAGAEEPDRTPAWPVFGSRNSELVDAARARTRRSTEETVYGEIPVDIVEFTDANLAPEILALVWREYHSAHELVREWLYALGCSPDLRVGARAGVAAGLLSIFEFDHARTKLIEPWARSGSRYGRAAAMAALHFPFLYSDLAPLVSRMLATWLQRDQPLALRVTAARALGSEIGQAMPDTAVRRLRRAARSNRVSLRVAVSFSMAQLFWSDGLADRILMELLRWTESTAKPQLRDTGLRCVLDLCRYRSVPTEQSVYDWPVTLCLTGANRAAIVTLFSRLLRNPDHPPDTYAEIRAWVADAEEDPAMREPLARLLSDLGDALQDADIFPYYLREWATEPRGPRRAAQEILAIIESPGRSGSKQLELKG